MDQNEEFFARFMNEPDFQKFITEGLAEQSYNKIKVQKAFNSDLKTIQ
ncbi:MAG TPA: hypothetical protein VHA52_03505 [Candidatus Babeliaceae bacterium]|nr:hypothetical protein [Candidatus Babeliaceae bacterium]